MNQTELTESLKDLPLGKISFFKTIESTNDLAGEWAGANVPDLSLVVSDEQTKGRGRAGNKWYTYPDSSIALSLLLRPPQYLKPELVQMYTGLGAISVCDALETKYRLSPEIKWPNDILLGGEKLCGVLAEAHWSGDNLQAIILGIGINITQNSIPLINNNHLPATYLEKHLTNKVIRSDFLKSILENIIKWRTKIEKPNFISAWEARLAYKGKLINLISTNNPIHPARIKHLAPDGSLVVEYPDMTEGRITAGEIHLRPIVDSDEN